MAASSKNDNRQYVQCINCKRAKAFMQWFKNPVIAVCGEDGERQVAATKRMCKFFVQGEERDLPAIQHFDSYDNS